MILNPNKMRIQGLFNIIFKYIILFISINSTNASDKIMLVSDYTNDNNYPKNFRILYPNYISNLNQTGLYKIKAVGSAQFSYTQLKKIVDLLKHKQSPLKIIVIDLRAESHGFNDDIPISWYSNNNWDNIKKSKQDIDFDEHHKLSELANLKHTEIFLIEKNIDKTKNFIANSTTIKNPQSEEKIVKAFGLDYQRFYVNDHMRPSNDEVNRFIRIVKDLNHEDWLYIHCRAGRGRTTSFLAIYDILKNAKSVSLEDIISRQHQLGGIDLANIDVADWKKHEAIDRLNFFQSFYKYAKYNNDNYKTKFFQ